jgi:molecular chaperone IbpA
MELKMSKINFATVFPDYVGGQRLLDKINEFYDDAKKATSFPPYNIIESDDGMKYTVELAVAGYNKDELQVKYQDNSLIITGNKVQTTLSVTDTETYLHRGIASRDFTRKFLLGDDIVIDSVKVDNGILTAKMTRIVPDAKKPRIIDIA